MLFITKRVTGTGVLKTHRRGDIACFYLFDLVLLVGVHLKKTTDALLLTLPTIQNVRTCAQLSGIDPEERQLSYIRVGQNLEGQGAKRLVRARFTLELFLFVRRVNSFDRRLI